MQTFIVMGIVVVSALYMVRIVLKSFKNKSDKSCSGCSDH